MSTWIVSGVTAASAADGACLTWGWNRGSCLSSVQRTSTNRINSSSGSKLSATVVRHPAPPVRADEWAGCYTEPDQGSQLFLRFVNPTRWFDAWCAAADMFASHDAVRTALLWCGEVR